MRLLLGQSVNVVVVVLRWQCGIFLFGKSQPKHTTMSRKGTNRIGKKCKWNRYWNSCFCWVCKWNAMQNFSKQQRTKHQANPYGLRVTWFFKRQLRLTNTGWFSELLEKTIRAAQEYFTHININWACIYFVPLFSIKVTKMIKNYKLVVDWCTNVCSFCTTSKIL